MTKINISPAPQSEKNVQAICGVCGATQIETAPNSNLAVLGLAIQGWGTDGIKIYCLECNKKRKAGVLDDEGGTAF
jgi:hypothetical protein